MAVNKILAQACGEYLGSYSWDWYCILSFRNNVSPKMAFKTFNKWKVELKKAVNHRIEYVLFIEPTRNRDNIPHIHVLLKGVGEEKPYLWKRRWYSLAGNAIIKRYDPELGASYYLGNKMLSDKVSVVFSKNLRSSA